MDVADLFERKTVLIVVIYVSISNDFCESTNEVIFQFSDFVDEDAEFVGDIRDVIIAFFTPYRELFSDFLPLTRNLSCQPMSHAK